MTEQARLQEFLAAIKSKGRSSPSGKSWADFHAFLKRHTRPGEPENLPMPLILAASGESNRAKHERLAQQLRWAIERGCFAEALAFLENLDGAEQWNFGSSQDWDRDSY